MSKEKELENIIITMEDGTTKDAELLFGFEVAGEEFIIYRCDDLAYAARYNEDDTLSPIREDEWKVVEKIYNDFLESDEYSELEDDELEDDEEDSSSAN